MTHPIDQLSISGFKSIRKLDQLKLNNLNVLIGGNGAGKSNLIGFFRLLDACLANIVPKHFRENGGVGDFLFNGRKTTESMRFEVLSGAMSFRFEIEAGLKDEPLVNQSATNLEFVSAFYKREIPLFQIYHFHDTSKTSPMRHYEIIQHNKILDYDAGNIAPFLLRLKNKHPAAYNDILDSIRLVMPFFDDFILDVTDFGERKKVNLSWKQKGSDYPMQPYHLSDGSLRFICLATALLQPEPPATIIIDEPELGLHPHAIAILAELIQSVSNQTQLIVATQSVPLINHFSIEDIIVVNRQDGASTFKRLKEKDFESWFESYSVGDLWTKDVITGGPVYE